MSKAPTWENMLGPIEAGDLRRERSAKITALELELRVASPCLVGRHDRCRGIVRSLTGDRECECPMPGVHDHKHKHEEETA